jgi:hypothetical protein
MEEVEVMSAELEREALCAVAAHGILDHNSAVSIPNEYTLDGIASLMWGEGSTSTRELRHALDRLTDGGLLRKRNTGSPGYGDTYVSGPDVWSVRPDGLVYLWMGVG